MSLWKRQTTASSGASATREWEAASVMTVSDALLTIDLDTKLLAQKSGSIPQDTTGQSLVRERPRLDALAVPRQALPFESVMEVRRCLVDAMACDAEAVELKQRALQMREKFLEAISRINGLESGEIGIAPSKAGVKTSSASSAKSQIVSSSVEEKARNGGLRTKLDSTKMQRAKSGCDEKKEEIPTNTGKGTRTKKAAAPPVDQSIKANLTPPSMLKHSTSKTTSTVTRNARSLSRGAGALKVTQASQRRPIKTVKDVSRNVDEELVEELTLSETSDFGVVLPEGRPIVPEVPTAVDPDIAIMDVQNILHAAELKKAEASSLREKAASLKRRVEVVVNDIAILQEAIVKRGIKDQDNMTVASLGQSLPWTDASPTTSPSVSQRNSGTGFEGLCIEVVTLADSPAATPAQTSLPSGLTNTSDLASYFRTQLARGSVVEAVLT